jgi:hypothetical protein
MRDASRRDESLALFHATFKEAPSMARYAVCILDQKKGKSWEPTEHQTLEGALADIRERCQLPNDNAYHVEDADTHRWVGGPYSHDDPPK